MGALFSINPNASKEEIELFAHELMNRIYGAQ